MIMTNIPLPELLRPKNLSQFVGQYHLAGKEGIIRKLLASAKRFSFPSLIFWGPPGSGKTTLARIIANTLKGNILSSPQFQLQLRKLKK